MAAPHGVLEPQVAYAEVELGDSEAGGQEVEGGMYRKPQNLECFDKGEGVPQVVAGGLCLLDQAVLDTEADLFELALQLLEGLFLVGVFLFVHHYILCLLSIKSVEPARSTHAGCWDARQIRLRHKAANNII